MVAALAPAASPGTPTLSSTGKCWSTCKNNACIPANILHLADLLPPALCEFHHLGFTSAFRAVRFKISSTVIFHICLAQRFGFDFQCLPIIFTQISSTSGLLISAPGSLPLVARTFHTVGFGEIPSHKSSSSAKTQSIYRNLHYWAQCLRSNELGYTSLIPLEYA